MGVEKSGRGEENGSELTTDDGEVETIEKCLDGTEIGCIDGIVVCIECRGRKIVPYNKTTRFASHAMRSPNTKKWTLKGIICGDCAEVKRSIIPTRINRALVTITLKHEPQHTPQVIETDVDVIVFGRDSN